MPAAITHSPAEIMAQLLVDIGQASGPGGTGTWPVFITAMTDSPDSALGVWDTTGIPDGRCLIPGHAPDQHYGVQITVRAPDHPRCWRKAEAVRTALAAVSLRTVWIDGVAYTIPAVTRLDPVLNVGKDRPNSTRVLMTLNPTFALHTSDE